MDLAMERESITETKTNSLESSANSGGFVCLGGGTLNQAGLNTEI